MILTKETDYALRILRILSEKERCTAGEIAQKEAVPQQFAYKILKKLEKSGYIAVTRGKEGGFSLQIDLREKSLHDLVSDLDSDTYLIGCMKPRYLCDWTKQREETCKVHIQLKKIQDFIDEELKSHILFWILFGGA